MQTEKITHINPNSIYNHFQHFLKELEINSKNTKDNYERAINQFFTYLNKDIKYLTPEDLDISRSQIVDYQNYLYEQKQYTYETIKAKLNPLKSFYEYLKINKFNVTPEIFKPKRFPKKSNPYGFLSWDEGILLAQLALTERTKKHEKHALLLLALYTSFRRSALLSLTYNQIRPSEYTPGRYIITVFDKGKTVEEEIDQELYEKLLFIKSKFHNDNRVFHLTEKTINETIKRLVKKAGFDPRRNITLHSFKKAGVDTVHKATNDIHAAQKQGKHSSVTTTINHYIENKPNSILLDILESNKISDDIFDQLTREEAIQLLKNTKNGTKIFLKKEAQRIINNRQQAG